MALRQGRIGSNQDIIQYDDADYDTDANFPSQITIGNAPTADDEVIRYQDIPALDSIISSDAVIADNALVRGDGGDRKVQESEVYIDDSGNVGIGTTSPEKTLHTVSSSNILLERTSTSASANKDINRMKFTTTEDMIDGFGGILSWVVEDNSGVENINGRLIVRRDGADDKGEFIFNTGNGGINALAIEADGNVGVGTTSPAAKLDVTGDVAIGDEANGDYCEIKSDGEIELHGDARVLNYTWLPADAIKAPGAKPATAIAHGTLEVPAWQFADQGVVANQETVSINMQIPSDMDLTVAPTLCVGWSSSGISPGVCEWQFEYLYTSAGEDTTSAAQDTLTVSDTAPATSDGLVISETAAMDSVSSTDMCIHVKVTRLSAGTTDTIANTVELLGLAFHYTLNKLGTSIT